MFLNDKKKKKKPDKSKSGNTTTVDQHKLLVVIVQLLHQGFHIAVLTWLGLHIPTKCSPTTVQFDRI